MRFFFFTSLIPWSRRRAWWSDRDLDLTARVTERWEKLLGIWIYLGKWLESTKSRLLWSSTIQLDWIIFAVMLYKWLMYRNTLPSYTVYWWFALLGHLNTVNHNHTSCNLYMIYLKLHRVYKYISAYTCYINVMSLPMMELHSIWRFSWSVVYSILESLGILDLYFHFLSPKESDLTSLWTKNFVGCLLAQRSFFNQLFYFLFCGEGTLNLFL